MLHSISVENFKSLRKASFQLRPITLLVGANNSGKSSFISLLLTLKQTLVSRGLEASFVLEGPYVQLGSYKDVVFSHDSEKRIGIEMRFIRPRVRLQRAFPMYRVLSGHYPISVSFKIEFDKKTETIGLDEFKVLERESNVLIEMRNKRIVNLYGKKTSIPTDIGPTMEGEKRRRAPRLYRRHFMLNVSLPYVKDRDIGKEIALRRISSVVEQIFEEYILYLGPLREYPKRYYISSGEKPSDVGLRGERTVDFLYLDRSRIIDQIEYWLRRFKMAEDIKVTRVAAGIWKVELTNLRTGISDNLKDVGFGVSQILPIVTEGIMAQPGTTIIVEQPEIHLHPRAQAQLADLFIQLAKDDKFSIIETHSEHMILRFARRIAEGSLKKDDIVIYEFKLGKIGSRVKEVSFDDYGNLKEWPAEFFGVELEETMKHVKAQARRKRDE